MNQQLKKSLDELKNEYPSFEEQIFLNDFPPNTKEEWLNEIYKVLEKSGKPKDLSAISWKTLDGFVVPPFYRKEDLENLKFILDYPGVYPFTRSKKFTQSWEVVQYIQGELKEIQEKIEQTTRRGADALLLPIGDRNYPFIFYGSSISLSQFAELQSYLKNFSFQTHFVGSSIDLYRLIDTYGVKGNILFDPFLDYLLDEDGSIYESELLEIVKKNLTSPFAFIAVRGDVFQHSGLPPAMELGFTISAFAEILNILHDGGIPLVEVLPKITLVQAIGSLYFLEIAKLRATRRLIAFVLQGFSVTDYKEGPKQFAVSSLFHHSIYDIHNNILRNTLSAMGAILGGVDSLVVFPITAVNQTDDEFSRRIAINTQLILKYESHFDYVVDPAGGSYYIENLTDLIMDKAWKIFLEIEDQGGFRKAIENGYIQKQIKDFQKSRIEQIKSRREFLLGVNQFPNPKDFIIKEFPTLQLMGKYNENHNSTKTIQLFRAATFFEELRLKTELLSEEKGIPLVQLIPFGNLAMQRARASFILNFFGCGGFEVDDPGDLKSKQEILDFIEKFNNPRIKTFVLCSSDPEYLEMFKEIRDVILSKEVPVIVAGLPETADQLRQLGIYDFIHIRSNLYEKLIEYQKLFFNL